MFEIYSNKNIEVSSQTIEGGDFTGYMMAWDLKIGFVRAAKFINNQVVEIGDAEFSNDISLTSRAPIEAPCVYSGGDGGCDKGGGKAIELREVVVTGPSTGSPVVYIPRDAVTGGISTGGFTSPGAGGASSGGGITVPTPAKIIDELVKQINSDKLKPCQKEVLEMLKNSTNANIAAMFNKLGVNTIYTVTFYSENTIDGTPASTQRVSQYNYKIQLSNDYSGATKLFRAGNILHELGHAYFMSIKDDYSSTTPPNVSVFNNYPVLFQGYVEKKYLNMYDAHHIEMANQYIDVIAQTLQEYNKSVDPSGIIPYQVYTDLAWGGLKGTPVFDEKFKAGTSERLRIDNRYAAEQTGNTVGYSTGQLQNTVGKPCN